MQAREISVLVNEICSSTKHLGTIEEQREYKKEITLLVAKIIRTSNKNFIRVQRKQVIDAIKLGCLYHKNFYRKDKKTPYIIHPLEVTVEIIDSGFIDFKLIIAAILHDTIEDIGGRKNKRELRRIIRKKFGFTIYSIVSFVTKHESSERRSRYYALMKSIKNPAVKWRAIILKIYDRIVNAKTFKNLSEENKKRKIKETFDEFPSLEKEARKVLLKSFLDGDIVNSDLLLLPEKAMDRLWKIVDKHT